MILQMPKQMIQITRGMDKIRKQALSVENRISFRAHCVVALLSGVMIIQVSQ